MSGSHGCGCTRGQSGGASCCGSGAAARLGRLTPTVSHLPSAGRCCAPPGQGRAALCCRPATSRLSRRRPRLRTLAGAAAPSPAPPSPAPLLAPLPQGTLKRLGVNTIPGIEEVLLINADGSALQFTNPKVQASIAANTYVVSGASQHKREPPPPLPRGLAQSGLQFIMPSQACSHSRCASSCAQRSGAVTQRRPSAQRSQLVSSSSARKLLGCLHGAAGLPGRDAPACPGPICCWRCTPHTCVHTGLPEARPGGGHSGPPSFRCSTPTVVLRPAIPALARAGAQDVMASMLAGMGGMAGLQQMMGGMGGGMPAFNPEGAADEPEDDDGAPPLPAAPLLLPGRLCQFCAVMGCVWFSTRRMCVRNLDQLRPWRGVRLARPCQQALACSCPRCAGRQATLMCSHALSPPAPCRRARAGGEL